MWHCDVNTYADAYEYSSCICHPYRHANVYIYGHADTYRHTDNWLQHPVRLDHASANA